MYTADAILIPGGMGPAAIGPEAITKFWEGAIKAGFKDHTFEIMETRADGNLAYLLSTWTVKQVKSSGEESTLQGHTLRVLVKQSDGTWQTKVHTFRAAAAGSAARSKEVNRLGRAPACTWAGAHRLQHGGDKARLGVSSHAANSSNNAFASFRSRVSNPSVNHP